MNIIAAIIAAIRTHFAASLATILAQIPALLVQGVLTLLSDEREILVKAIDKLLVDLKTIPAGATPEATLNAVEHALSDAFNVFYSGEVTEGNHIAMAFLETLSKIVSGLE